jgi:membrane-bound lytic murein transglycosylase D
VEKAGGTMDNPPSYWDIYPYLPQETRAFVPRYIATALIVSHPEFYGIPVEDLGQELAYDRVWIKGMLNLADAARFAGTDLPSIKNLNPALLRDTLPDDSEPFALKIPLGSHDRFVAALRASQPRWTGEEGLYVVKKGDVLSRIASNHKVSVAAIRTLNGLDDALINVGQTLRIPGQNAGAAVTIANTQREVVAYGKFEPRPIKLGEGFQLVQQNGSMPDKPLLAVRLTEFDPDEGVMNLVPTIYKVRSGDTLGAIAKRFEVSTASIVESNRITDHVIRPGQELTIYSAISTKLDPVVREHITTAQQSVHSYKVQSGDSLYDISHRFGVTLDTLRRRNSLSSDTIHIGQILLID